MEPTATKIKFQIKNRWTGNILFQYESETLRETAEKAVASGANLSDANLRDADLRDANLSDADLSDANLRDANLSGADLRDADLRDANLSDADLSGADLSDANLSGADLSDANLSGADLSDANLRDANLSGADLRDANLSDADLEPIKNDLFIVLLHSLPEIKFLKQAVIDGKIDGSTYSGSCACLSGTLINGAVISNGPQEEKTKNLILSCRNAHRPIERFFLGIRPGNTPENNQASKLVLEWIEEFERLINRGS